MQPRTIFSILAGVTFLLGPLLSNATPLPPNPHPYLTLTPNPQSNDPCNLANDSSTTGHTDNMNQANEHKEKPEKELAVSCKRAELRFTRDVIIEELRRIRTICLDQKWDRLQAEYTLLYLIMISRIIAFERILMELNQFKNTAFHSGIIISRVFHEPATTSPMEELTEKHWYKRWMERLRSDSTHDLERTLLKYEKEVTTETLIHAMQKFISRVRAVPIDKINEMAEMMEAEGRRKLSDVHMASSLFFRYIRVELEGKKITPTWLDTEIDRLSRLQFSGKFLKLTGLLNWLHIEYGNLYREILKEDTKENPWV